ncbi:unnamed protein product [Jaminaea pallidilutea]
MSTGTVEQRQAAHAAFNQPYAVSARYAAARAEREAQAAGADALLRAQHQQRQARPAFQEARDIKLTCPECRIDPPNLTEEYSSGDLVCADCGMILGDRIVDTRSEWRTFANEDGDDPSRVGQAANPILDGLTENLETRISARDGGTGVASALQRASTRTAGNSNRQVLDGFDAIQNRAERMSLPRSAAEAAKMLFRRVHDERIMRGRRTEAIIAAVLFVACKQSGNPRTFVEIQKVTNVNKKQIADCFKELQATFDLGASNARPEGSGGGVAVTSAVNLVGRFCNLLGLDRVVTRSTEEMAETIKDKGILDGRSPVTVAAACIYLSTTVWGMGATMTPRKIAEATGVSPVTIKGSYRDMIKFKDQILTPEILRRSSQIDPSRAVA